MFIVIYLYSSDTHHYIKQLNKVMSKLSTYYWRTKPPLML